VTELVFEDAGDLPYADLQKLLTIPKALKRFRFTEEIPYFGRSSSRYPVYRLLGESLSLHKDSLEVLDLNIDQYRRPTNVNSEINAGEVKGNHLIGSLKDFKSFKALDIEVGALCGDSWQGKAPYRMLNCLPTTLESLTLHGSMNRMGKDKVPGFDNEIWMEQLVELVAFSVTEFPKLRKVTVVAAGRCWEDTEDEELFVELKEACKKSNISLLVTTTFQKNRGWAKIQVPFFQSVNSTRSPGRDF
jgi:hypothetical protein